MVFGRRTRRTMKKETLKNNVMEKTSKGFVLLHFDVMYKGRFICQIEYKHCPLFKLDLEEVMEIVYDHRPSLEGKKGVEILETNNIVR